MRSGRGPKVDLDAKTPKRTLPPIICPNLNPTEICPAADYESTTSGLAGILISLKEDSSRALLEHKYIKPEDKAQNVFQSRPRIQIQNQKMAREVVKTVTTHQRKLAQTRRPWSDTKTENFLKLIERNGTR